MSKQEEEISKKEFMLFFRLMAKSLDAQADMLVTSGELEKKMRMSFEQFSRKLAEEGSLRKLPDILSEEAMGVFLRIMLTASSLGKVDPSKLSAEKKIKTGRIMKDLAADLQKLYTLTEKGEALRGKRK